MYTCTKVQRTQVYKFAYFKDLSTQVSKNTCMQTELHNYPYTQLLTVVHHYKINYKTKTTTKKYKTIWVDKYYTSRQVRKYTITTQAHK